MENILVTGANGQLGSEFVELSKVNSRFRFIFTDVEVLDICDYEHLKSYIQTHEISIILNCAAYTAVDKAETDIETAMKINKDGVKNLAKVSQEMNLFLVHISTDYVFGGQKFQLPISEEANPLPIGIYAKSKYEGELELLQSNANGLIIRTSWLYSPFGQNFVKTMLRLSSERQVLKVVYDQIGTPTYSLDLALVILQLLEENNLRQSGIHLYHYSNEGVCSWYDFAYEIVRQTKRNCTVLPITTSEYPLPAPRPAYSVFSKAKIKHLLEIEIPHWTLSLQHCLTRINTQK